MYTGLLHSHSGFAYLLMASTSLSLLLAIVTAATGAKPGVLRIAGILVRAEAALMGITGLIGLGMWFMGAWPVSAWWLWAGVVVLVLQGGLVARGVKPAMKAAADGAGASRWVGLAAAHWVLIVAIFGIMQAN